MQTRVAGSLAVLPLGLAPAIADEISTQAEAETEETTLTGTTQSGATQAEAKPE